GTTEGRERLDDGPVADEHEQRLGQIGLHVDLQGAAAVTRHFVLEHALGPARDSTALAVEADEPRPAIAESLERFAHDDGLGAGAADPSLHAPVPANEDLRAGLRRGRRLAAHDRGQRERLTGALKL